MQITMATEAQRLIGISLTKIAQSRAHRGGVSLHKNLLVATVLQKARYIFMEEAYHMVHTGSYCPPPTPAHVPQQPQDFDHQSYDEEGLVALTPEEAGISSSPLGPEETTLQEFLQPSCVRLTDDQTKDKENSPPPSYQSHSTELTYLDLDRSNSILRERGQQQQSTETGSTTCLKRRRAVTEWETEEAVMSILPKRSKSDSIANNNNSSITTATATTTIDTDDEGDDSVFLDEAALFSDCVAREVAAERNQEDNNNGSSAMEIDRITSLVSIFSFGNLAVNGGGPDGLGKLSRSVSTPDLCSAQAKESVDALQQRPFLAMTV